jgi:hypothetical protein
MDDSNTDIVFRPSPEYVGQYALAINCNLQLKTQTRYSQKIESPPSKTKDCGQSPGRACTARRHGRLIGYAT